MFGLKVKNLGNVRADLRMTAKIYSIWGVYDKKEAIQIGQVFPRKTISIQAPWPGKSRPIFGLYWASVTIEDAFKGLNPINSPLPASQPIHTWVVTFFIPWTQTAILVLLLFLIWFFIQLRRWRQMVALSTTPVVAYKIKPGDHLANIAARYGISWKLLAHLNEIKPPYSLHGVAQIYVPDAKGSRQGMRAPRFLAYLIKPLHRFWRRRSPDVIVVEPGDTKTDVEKFTGLSWKRLAAYNQLSPTSALKSGQELRVPSTYRRNTR